MKRALLLFAASLFAWAADAGDKFTAAPLSPGNVHEPASNTAAVVTYAASGRGQHVIAGGIAYSYAGGTPAGGNLKIEDGSGTTVLSLDIPTAGWGVIPLSFALRGSASKAMIVTLAAGGSGVTGKVTVLAHWIE